MSERMEPKMLSPTQEAENMIFKLRQRADLLLQAGEVGEEYAWTQREIARLERATGATKGVERTKDHDRSA
ncbi:MAG TPA: hypothetical protein VJY15_03100 [Candidatus Acidoferrum sp.]|nr:hypothetical protein [Candidatus Acidoferrum sp.]